MRSFNPRILAACLLIGLASLYFTGKLDRPLSEIGLNKNSCVMNAFGAKFCGDDAKRLCATLGGPACAEAGYTTDGSLTDQISKDAEGLDPSDSAAGGYNPEEDPTLDDDGDGVMNDADMSPYDPAES